MRTFVAFVPTVSAVTTFTTAPIPIGDNGNFAVGVTLSGADVAGTITLQASFTEDFTRPFLIQAATAVTTSTDTLLNINDTNYPYMRIIWTYSSGTGNITIDVSIRQQILVRG